jgi:polysaccharide biosynthesis/export protein
VIRLPIDRARRSAALLSLCLCGLLFSLGASPVAQAQYNGPPTSADRGSVAATTNDQALLFPSTPEPLLSVGDQISIRLYGIADYTFQGRISTDGTVLLPLIGITHLQGLSVTQAEQFIAQKLVEAGQYREPQVVLTMTEGPNANVVLSGEMHAVVPVVSSRTLYAAIAAGGGLPTGASRTVTILRPGHAEPISVDIGNDPLHSAAANIPLFPGDTVVVSRIGVVYVAGEFRSPGVVPITNYGPLTLSQVSAQVGGPIWDARYNELHIIRTVGDHRTVTTLNIKKVLYGKAPDPIMQPNDIVFLPPSPFKSSLANGSLGSFLGVISFALATVYTIR